jgi:phage/plasmid-associated DNA primase
MVTESGYSWFKRILLLPFLSTFIDDKDVNKIDELITPEELSGFLNLALVGLKLRKIGNSYMIAIPSQVIADLKLKVGDNMLLDIKDSRILIRKE